MGVAAPAIRGEPAGGRAGLFDRYRPLLLSIAYRMLGSVMDAEDMVQDAFLRWEQGADGDVASPKAYLSAVVTRLCIDHLRSARVRREQYVGPWLPEPLLGESESVDPDGDPADAVALADSLSMAFLVLLERLAPRERAAFLLREVFDYDYPEVARIVGVGEANCRQIVRRARQHLAEGRPRFAASPERHRAVTRELVQVLGRGDVGGLLGLLADDVTAYADGGGKVVAGRRPVHGAEAVARYLMGLMRTAPPETTFEEATVNGRPGLLTMVEGRLHNVTAFDVVDDRIRGIYIVVNPDKLRHAGT